MKNFTGNYFLWSRFHFLVIPTGANLNFLLRCTEQGRVCSFLLKERRMMFDNATNLYRKFGVAKRRDLRFRGPFDEMFFDGAKRFTDLSGEQQSVRGVEGPQGYLSYSCRSYPFHHRTHSLRNTTVFPPGREQALLAGRKVMFSGRVVEKLRTSPTI